jgi:hypothetical protein
MSNLPWLFKQTRDACVVTSEYVIRDGMPIVCASLAADEDGELTWQFHCGNGDFSAEMLRMVRLDEIVALDPSVSGIAELEVGYSATRDSPNAPWNKPVRG